MKNHPFYLIDIGDGNYSLAKLLGFGKTRGSAKPEVCTHYTARRVRPLARRAAITARPPRVFIRTKKPWVRARRTFDG